MSANFYAWTPSLALDANAKDFAAKIDALYEEQHEPDLAMQAFVTALLQRHPDLTEDDNAVWAAGPLQDEILGRFVNVAVSFKRADEVWAFFRDTAKAHGLFAYDPQAEKLYAP